MSDRTLDWQEICARLARARRALEPDETLPPEEVGRILRERALAVAKPVEEARNPAELLELLILSLGGERYGIETVHVLEVAPLRDLTPVPCTPPFVLGVVHHRGRILPVLALRSLLELGGQGVADGRWVVAVDVAGMTLGILADAVAGIARVAAQELAPPPVALTGARGAFTRGVTGEMVAVLDLEGLARDRRLMVNEEVD